MSSSEGGAIASRKPTALVVGVLAVAVLAVLVGLMVTSIGSDAADHSGDTSCPNARYALRYNTNEVQRAGAIAIFDSDGHSTHPGGNWITGEPSFSPDGRRLAVTRFDSTDESRNTAIAILGVDRKSRRIVRRTERGQYPAWSPDGSTIAYARNDFNANVREIRLMDARSGANNRVIVGMPDRNTNVASPTWSPDGKQIAFLVTNPFSVATTVWVVNADGSNLHQIPTPATGPDSPDFDLVSWHPNGNTLLLSRPAGSPALLDLATQRFTLVADEAIAASWSGQDNEILYYGPGRSETIDNPLMTATIAGTRLRDVSAVPHIPPQRVFPQSEGIAISCRTR